MTLWTEYELANLKEVKSDLHLKKLKKSQEESKVM